jgi:hypothetical protein
MKSKPTRGTLSKSIALDIGIAELESIMAACRKADNDIGNDWLALVQKYKNTYAELVSRRAACIARARSINSEAANILENATRYRVTVPERAMVAKGSLAFSYAPIDACNRRGQDDGRNEGDVFDGQRPTYNHQVRLRYLFARSHRVKCTLQPRFRGES